MKNTPLLFALLFCSISAFCQKIPQGTRFLGGNVDFSFQHSNTEDAIINNNAQISFSPSLTKFKKDNFSITYALGYGLGVNSYKPFTTNAGNITRNSNNSLSVGLYFKNYKMLSDKLGLSVQYGGNIGFTLSRYYVNNPNKPSAESASEGYGVNFNIGVGPGIIYLLNEKIALEGNTSLVNFYVGNSWSKGHNSFSIGTGLSASPSLGLGIRYFLKERI